MMLITSLIELPIAKTRMWKKHKIQLAKFDKASLRVIWFRRGRWLLTELLGANRESVAEAQHPATERSWPLSKLLAYVIPLSCDNTRAN
jgi:hypothetical protein